MTRRIFDVAVLGLGTMGSFACLELARRHAAVIGFDRFVPPHDRGSHSGETRVYRAACGEHPDYVPLALRAGELWDRLGEEAGTRFLHRCGMLNIGSEESELITGIRRSVAAHRLEIEEVTAAGIRERFPAFAPPRDSIGIYEAGAGWMDVNPALQFVLASARRLGAEVRLGEAVNGWRREGGGFGIETSQGTVLVKRLVITAGAWTGQLLADLKLPLTVLRKVLAWVDPLEADLFRPDCFPIFSFGNQFLYGFPNIGGRGVKIAIHWDSNALITDAHVPQPTPSTGEIEPALRLVEELVPRLAGPMPEALARVLSSKTCLYTMTPDEHFIVDRHPNEDGAYFAAGFSGHGFKYAPVIGEALADLAMTGRTALPVEFLRLKKQ